MRRLLIASALLAATLIPATASAQALPDEDCAVVSRDGSIVVVHASTYTSGVARSGSTCTQDIQSGNWRSASRNVNWLANDWTPVCFASYTDGDFVVAFAKFPGDYRSIAYSPDGECQFLEHSGASVTYY